jgi:hypothetical protein
MNRREFLSRLAGAGLVLANTRTIFDLGAHKYRDNAVRAYPDSVYFNNWRWQTIDPFNKLGHFCSVGEMDLIGLEPPIPGEIYIRKFECDYE